MKFQILKPLACLLMMGLGTKSFAETAQGTMKAFEIRSCSVEGLRCITVKSEAANGSPLRNILFFRDPQVEIVQQGKLKPEVLHGTSGYFDLDLNRIVLRNRLNGDLQEQIVDMKTLRIVKW